MSSLQILQYNTQKSKNKVMIPLFEDHKTKEFDIIAVQEPWSNPLAPTTYNPRQSEFHLVYGKEKGRTCFCVNKKLDTNKWTEIFHSPDFCSVQIELEDQVWNIHNLYSQPLGNSRNTEFDSPIWILGEVLKGPGQHIVLGDFNLHHPLWSGLHDPTFHDMSTVLIDCLQEYGLTLLTPPGTTTWEARGASSTLDLVFGSELARDRLIECRVRHHLDHGSDHYPLGTIIGVNPQHAPVRRARIWKKMDIALIKERAVKLA
jgi:hypothetical protein